MKRPSGVADVAWYDIERAITARDAEHRAELLKLQDDLLQGADREVMTAALVERLRGELAAAKRLTGLAHQLLHDIRQQEGLHDELDDDTLAVMGKLSLFTDKSAPLPVESKPAYGRHGPHAFVDVGADGCCAHFETNDVGFEIFCGLERGASIHGGSDRGDHALVAAVKAAPPPAESTPVHEYVSSRTGACMECGKAIGERPPHLPKPAPPDGIRERLYDHSRRLAALEAKGEPGTHAFRCQDRHPKDRADCKTEGFDCVCDCGAKRNEHPKGAKP